jgi:hypothetical protein
MRESALRRGRERCPCVVARPAGRRARLARSRPPMPRRVRRGSWCRGHSTRQSPRCRGRRSNRTADPLTKDGRRFGRARASATATSSTAPTIDESPLLFRVPALGPDARTARIDDRVEALERAASISSRSGCHSMASSPGWGRAARCESLDPRALRGSTEGAADESARTAHRDFHPP